MPVNKLFSKKGILDWIIGIIFTFTGAAIALLVTEGKADLHWIALLASVISFFAGVAFSHYFLSLLVQYKSVGNVRSIDATIDKFKTEKIKSCIREYNEYTIQSAADIIDQLQKQSADLDSWQFERIMKIILRTKAQYDGIDYHLPSKYMHNYEHYLTDHEKSLVNTSENDRGHRIVVAEPEELRKDALNPDFSRFYDWHKENKVKLHSITKTVIKSILDKHRISHERCASGMGLWRNQFAILFGELRNDRITTHIIEKGDTEFPIIEECYKEIIASSKNIDPRGAYNMIPEVLVKEWMDYVNPEKRWSIIKPFLYTFLEKYKDSHWIMDAASGIGVEYLYMTKDGFMMSANEYQKDMRDGGKEFIEKSEADMQYEPTKYDWREMNTMAFRKRYGAVLMIGNSLRVLQDRTGQQDAVNVFYDMLRDDGMLIIDERNYDRFVKKQIEIKDCETHPNNSQLFQSLMNFSSKPPNPMYHSTDLKAIPCMIDTNEGRIVFRYYHRGANDARNMTEVLERKIHEWEFLHGQKMEIMLKKAGFVDVEKYLDYDLNRKVESDEIVDDAAMYVYVARKPKT